MPKRTRQKKKVEEQDDFNIEQEIESIKDPRQALLEVTGIKAKRDEKSKTKNSKQLVKTPQAESKYKKLVFSSEEHDILLQHFNKDLFCTYEAKKRKLKVQKFSSISSPCTKVKIPYTNTTPVTTTAPPAYPHPLTNSKALNKL